MKKLKKLASRFELAPGSRGAERGKKSGGREKGDVGDSRVKYTERRSERLPYEITGSVDEPTEERPGIIGKIYATLQGTERGEKKPRRTILNERHEKKLDNPRTKDRQCETRNFDKIEKKLMIDSFGASSGIQAMRYQEVKRTLSNARDSFVTSPLHPAYDVKEHRYGEKKKKTLCEDRGCKQVKSKVEFREAETDVTVDLQELIGKIQELKKTVEDLEAAKRNAPVQRAKVSEENASSQTTGRFITDLLGVREALGTCSSDLMKLRKFCQSRDCIKQIEDRRGTACCDEKSGHLHTLIDGLGAVVKFPEEELPETRQRPLAETHKIASEIHGTPESVTSVKVVEVPEKGDEEMSREAKRGEAKRMRDLTCAEVCAIDEAVADSRISSKLDCRKNVEGVPSCSRSKKDLPILEKKSDSKIKDQDASNKPKKEESQIVDRADSEGSQNAARSRDAWYGKPPIVSENCPLETFTSENAPRIKSSGKKTDRGLRDSKPFLSITDNLSSPKSRSRRERKPKT